MVECNSSINIFLLGLASSMLSDIRSSPADQRSKMEFAYVFCVTSLVVISLISNILSIMVFARQKLRKTTVGTYLLCYSIYSPIGMLMLQFRLIQFIDWLSYVPFFIICNVVSGLASVFTHLCLWMNAFIALQRSLEAMGRGGRVTCASNSAVRHILVLTIVIVAMHIHEFYSRVTLPDPVAPDKWVCKITYTGPLNILNTVFTSLHLFAPFLLNLLSTLLLIKSVTKRELNQHNASNYWETCQKQLKRHRDLFIAPVLSIICMLPQFVLLLKYSCVDLTIRPVLRLYISASLIIYLPQTFTFLVYIYPSVLCYSEFQLQIRRMRHCCRIDNDVVGVERRRVEIESSYGLKGNPQPTVIFHHIRSVPNMTG